MLRKEFIALSLLSFFSLLTKKVFGDTIEKPKMTTLKNFFSCNVIAGDVFGYFVFDLSPYFSPGWQCESVTSPPTGFTELNGYGGSLYGYRTEATPGTYEIEIRARATPSDEWTSFLLNFELTITCATEQELCCDSDTIGIRWLGREGGIKQWEFTGVRTFDVRVGEANQFKNNNLQAQYSQRSNIYNGKVITSGSISKEQADFLDELKYAIQAWEWDGENSTAILINNESFDKYKSTQKFYDVSLAYIIAAEVIIQSQ